MIALIQRVTEAEVTVAGESTGKIGAGLLALVAAQPDDTDAQLEKMAEKLLNYRVFADDDGKMNRSLRDTGGGLLLVSQFTLAADTRSGLRPSFSTAARPELAEPLFETFVEMCRKRHAGVETGRFRAHMEVRLVNDGPVTFLLQT
ncbi:D-tyrosyl-tRNA(Tyr) deacylase [Lysobacter sp. HDW10]|uniref:D-aminoacyl-tRNA deacylase n=1 Tax=Lysobacter sp. HDW10 TaxID=2714936 RepID=UPI00140C8151|nr:D-aminoacyl-tRNA deacylase [Lysobacter sp. HDW10]QIK80999.1 D-tyrosyl-tRNA(Tyr) deacylase [Lysobacter sp. HDW10]